MKTRLILCCCGLLLSAGAFSGDGRVLGAGTRATYDLSGDRGDPAAPKVYIVQLRAPSAVEHVYGQAAGPGKPSGTRAFDASSSMVAGYAQTLADAQQRVVARAGPGARQIYSYRYAFNGFAARMTPAQAVTVEHLPEVAGVWEDEVRPLTTNHSAEFLGLFEEETGLRASGLDGEGVVIGVIDSGIVPEHPSLSDTRPAPMPALCESSWAENSLLGKWLCRPWRRQAEVLAFEPPQDWNGTCQAGPEFAEDACNNKLVGARYFFEGAADSGPIDPGEIFSARDVDGHGTHTATTAAGNRVEASIFGTVLGRVEGMAPGARVAVYKACWLRPDATRSHCNTSDLALAIDTAVADGVDIINYSVGNSMREVTAPDDIALMNATKAGVLAVVAAGNDGPNFATIGSPAGAPWVITAAASSRDGEHSLEAMEIDEPSSIAGRYAVREAAFTPPLEDSDPIEAELVLVDDDSSEVDEGFETSSGTTFDACQALINDDVVADNVALVQRGGCDFTVKVENAQAAGAVAVVVINIAGPPIVMTGTPGTADIPALMVGQADGDLFLDEIDAGETVAAVLDKGLFLTVEDTGNRMGSFSSRGPGPSQDILKPDVTAPGIDILAGFTPDAINSMSGESFAFLTGTSMSTPHVAGVAALLKQEHPDWSPAALKSALMTTAYQDVNASNGESDAIAFDFGAGHIDPNAAADPGLVYDVTDEEYDAYACGIGAPGVDPAFCGDEELAARGLSKDGSALNQPSIAAARVAGSETVSRRVTNVGDSTEAYTAEIEMPPGIVATVTPQTLSVAPGESDAFDVRFDYDSGPLDTWRFGSLRWVGDDHAARSVLAVRPVSLSAPAEVFSFGGTGDLTFPVVFGYDGTYSTTVHGLTPPGVTDATVDRDPDKTFSGFGPGVTPISFVVPANQLYLRFAMFDEFTDGEDDLDMYVYYCLQPDNCTKIGESGEPTSNEEFDIILPAAGEYLVLVHGFDTDDEAGGPGASFQLFFWRFGVNDDRGNMSVTAPAAVSAGSTEDVRIDWSGLATNTHYLGGISHITPDGRVALTVVDIRN